MENPVQNITQLIGLSSKGVADTTSTLANISIDDAFAFLKCIPNGKKDGSYITRATFKEGATGHSDADMCDLSNLIILDGDKTVGESELGAPCMYKVHENLKAAGINHLIVRSYSHQRPGYGNRYRIYIITLLSR